MRSKIKKIEPIKKLSDDSKNLANSELIKDTNNILKEGTDALLLNQERSIKFNRLYIENQIKLKLEENTKISEQLNLIGTGKLFEESFEASLRATLEKLKPEIETKLKADLENRRILLEEKKRDNDYFLNIWKGKI